MDPITYSDAAGSFPPNVPPPGAAPEEEAPAPQEVALNPSSPSGEEHLAGGAGHAAHAVPSLEPTIEEIDKVAGTDRHLHAKLMSEYWRKQFQKMSDGNEALPTKVDVNPPAPHGGVVPSEPKKQAPAAPHQQRQREIRSQRHPAPAAETHTSTASPKSNDEFVGPQRSQPNPEFHQMPLKAAMSAAKVGGGDAVQDVVSGKNTMRNPDFNRRANAAAGNSPPAFGPRH